MNTNEPAPIVCGTDFSDTATEAAKIAAMMANQLCAPLKLVFSRDSMAMGSTPDAAEAIGEHYRDRLKETIHELSKTGASIEAILAEGSPYKALIKVVEEQQARLLVVGWHGVNTRWRIGSVAERAAESCPVPTLVVQDPKPFKEWLNKDRPLKVFVGVDFSQSSKAALQLVADLHNIAPCEITTTYIDKPTDELSRMGYSDSLPNIQGIVEEDLQEIVDEVLGPNDSQVTVFGNWASKPIQLIELAEKKQADLIVVGSHQRHGIDQLRHDSVSREILHSSPTNVACAPAPSVKSHTPPSVHRCKRVLAAVDLNEPYELAAAHAYSIVDSSGEVLLLYNIQSKIPEDAPTPTEEFQKRLLEFVPKEMAGRDILTKAEVTTEPNTANAICRAAERFNADVICVGSHTRPGFTAKILGSVSLGVLQKSQRPVLLVVPSKANY